MSPGAWLDPPDGATFDQFDGNGGGQLFYDDHADVPTGQVWASRSDAPGFISESQYYPDGFANTGSARLVLIDDTPRDLTGISPVDVLGVTTPVGAAGFEWEDTAPLAGARLQALGGGGLGSYVFIQSGQRSGATQTKPDATAIGRAALLDPADLTLGSPVVLTGWTGGYDVDAAPVMSTLAWTDLGTAFRASSSTTGNVTEPLYGAWDFAFTASRYLVINAISDWELDNSHPAAPLIVANAAVDQLLTPLARYLVPRYRWLFGGSAVWPLRQHQRVT